MQVAKNHEFENCFDPSKDNNDETFCVYGLAATDEEILLANSFTNADKKIWFIMYNEFNVCQCTKEMKNIPFDIALLPGKPTCVFSSREDKVLQLVNFECRSNTFEVKLNAKEKTHIGGVAATKDRLYVGYKSEIFVLDRQGNTMYSIKTKPADKLTCSLAV